MSSLPSITGTVIVEEPTELQDLSRPATQPSPRELEAGVRPSRRRSSAPGVRRNSSTLSVSASQSGRPAPSGTVLTPSSDRQPPSYVIEDDALHGYPKLALYLSRYDGHAIYKRFLSLNTRNLLYQQAKLVHLEHDLHEMENGFAHERRLHYKVQHIFGAETGSTGHTLRRKHEEVSVALDKYNDLLLRQQKLFKLPKPDNAYVEAIHNFIKGESEDPAWLQYPEDKVYAVWDEDRQPTQRDLVCLNQEFKNRDPFTRFFINNGIEWWDHFLSRWKKPDDEWGQRVYTRQAIERWMRATTIFVASALPTTSIIALDFIEASTWRLIFIVLFSGFFASILAFLTEAKRVEVFTASLALASVQVVFVGTAFGNGGDGGLES